MRGFVGILLVLSAGACVCAQHAVPETQPHAPASTQPAVRTDRREALEPAVRATLRRLKEAAAELERVEKDDFGLANASRRRLSTLAEEVEAEMTAACARIEVDPRAEQAAAFMRRGDFARALDPLAAVLAERADDPYVSYLAGICAAELGNYDKAQGHFGRVLKREPESHTARLLSAFCECAQARPQPLTDESVMACYDAAHALAEKHLAPEDPNEADDPSSLVESMYGVTELLRDPLVYLLGNEAAAGRGPLAIERDRVLRVALESDDTFELFAGWVLAEDEGDAERFEKRLAAPRHADTFSALSFLVEYYDDDGAYCERAPAFERDLADLRRRMSDEGLWWMLSIPQRDPVGESYDPPPLTPEEFELFEKAVAAPRFTNYNLGLTAAAQRVLTRAGCPWGHRAADQIGKAVQPLFVPFRNTAKRARALAEQHCKAGELERGVHVVRTLLRFHDRLEPHQEGWYGLVIVVRAAYREFAATTILEHVPSSNTAVWLEHQWLRLSGRRDLALVSATITDNVGVSLPVSVIADANRRLVNGRWEDWKVARARRMANTQQELATRREDLEWHLSDGIPPHETHLLEPGILKLTALLPQLRRFREAPLDDDRLWMLVWTLGELQDRDSVDWPVAQLGDPREWLRITAVEALRKITGQDHGRDADAWREATQR